MKKKLLNKLMKTGLKSKAEKIYSTGIKVLNKQTMKNCLEIIKLAVLNSSPAVSIRKKFKNKKRKKHLMEVPFILTKSNRISFAIDSILNLIKKNPRKECVKNLVNEFLQASQNIGLSVLKKQTVHEEAFLKKKFAKFRWF